MAKLSARGRTALASLVKLTTFPNARLPLDGDPSDIDIEWFEIKRRYMSDGHVLVKERWKSLKWTKPYDTGWKDRGKLTEGLVLDNVVAQRLAKGWQREQ